MFSIIFYYLICQIVQFTSAIEYAEELSTESDSLTKWLQLGMTRTILGIALVVGVFGGACMGVCMADERNSVAPLSEVKTGPDAYGQYHRQQHTQFDHFQAQRKSKINSKDSSSSSSSGSSSSSSSSEDEKGDKEIKQKRHKRERGKIKEKREKRRREKKAKEDVGGNQGEISKGPKTVTESTPGSSKTTPAPEISSETAAVLANMKFEAEVDISNIKSEQVFSAVDQSKPVSD